MGYYSANEYFKNLFGSKVYKITLKGGMNCPNRDGTLDTRGCIFCSPSGSGDFALPFDGNITEILEEYSEKLKSKAKINKFISYFQDYCNTYNTPKKLEELYLSAIDDPRIVGLSIATRPDLLPKDILTVLDKLNRIKPVFVELGLQTIHPQTAKYIRRGYELSVYDKAVKDLNSLGIRVITHQILGLPGETKEMMWQTTSYIGKSGVSGIKFHLLHVIKDTDLEKDYLDGLFNTLDLNEYIDILEGCIQRIPPQMAIHRLTGDGAKKYLIAPLYSGNKKMVLNEINRRLKADGIVQGKLFV